MNLQEEDTCPAIHNKQLKVSWPGFNGCCRFFRLFGHVLKRVALESVAYMNIISKSDWLERNIVFMVLKKSSLLAVLEFYQDPPPPTKHVVKD